MEQTSSRTFRIRSKGGNDKCGVLGGRFRFGSGRNNRLAMMQMWKCGVKTIFCKYTCHLIPNDIQINMRQLDTLNKMVDTIITTYVRLNPIIMYPNTRASPKNGIIVRDFKIAMAVVEVRRCYSAQIGADNLQIDICWNQEDSIMSRYRAHCIIYHQDISQIEGSVF